MGQSTGVETGVLEDMQKLVQANRLDYVSDLYRTAYAYECICTYAFTQAHIDMHFCVFIVRRLQTAIKIVTVQRPKGKKQKNQKVAFKVHLYRIVP